MNEATQGHVGAKPYFFGRDFLLRSLLQGTEKGWSFGVCGGPKSGKTSLIYQLQELSRKKWLSRSHGTKIVPIIVELSFSKRPRPGGLAGLLWKQIVDALNDPLVRGGSGEMNIPRPNFQAQRVEPWELLTESCSELWEELRGQQGWCRYVLCIDGGDYLLTKQFKHELQPLIEFVQLKQEYAPHAVIIAGTRVLREYLFDDVGYFHHWLRPLVLPPLLESEALAMIRYWLPEASLEQANQILSLTGSQPYLTARILHEIKMNGLLSNIRAATDAAVVDLEVFFDSIWAEFDLGRGVTYRGAYAAPEHALMQLLLDCGETGITIKSAERELGMRPLKDYCDFLEYQGLVERTLRGNERIMRSRCALWSDWYRDRISM